MTDLLSRRRSVLGPNLPTFYEEPVHIVKGEGVWLWDASGRKYLDCYNNVPHVGHCHPHVVEAIAQQAATLNTHTRYLHDGIVDYGERLTGKFEHDISQLIMVCTGSEANDIALRMAQAVTGQIGIIATDNTYHGNTTAVSQLSSRRPPIGGYAPHVRLVPAPDSINPVGGRVETQAEAFAHEVEKAIHDLKANGFGLSGMMICPSFANEGFPELPHGFLAPTVSAVQAAGGLMLCDEVQPGFGRMGSHFWGHDMIGFAPDVVTIGKPMANGHPVAAVLTRPDIMRAFRKAFGYFNTFGGNPVSVAAASATLDIIEQDDLQTNAQTVGQYCLDRLATLEHPFIVEARGRGLFFGVEMWNKGVPATAFTARIVEFMKAHGVLLNTIGRHRNTLKMRPPMPFSADNAAMAMDVLEHALAMCRAMIDGLEHAVTAWGARDVALIGQRENTVYKAITQDGAIALRVHREGYQDRASIDGELRWMVSLSKQGFPCPKPILSKADNWLETLPTGQLVSAVSWLEGAPLGGHGVPLANAPERYYRVGRLLAELHNITDASGDSYPRHSWSNDGLLGSDPLWGRFWENPALTTSERAVVLQARQDAQATLTALEAADYGLIHADAMQENILSMNGEMSLIDFDDSGYGYRLYDLGTALIQHIDAPDYRDIQTRLWTGYVEVRNPPVTVKADLSFFVMLRAMASAGWILERGSKADPRFRVYAERMLRAIELYQGPN